MSRGPTRFVLKLPETDGDPAARKRMIRAQEKTVVKDLDVERSAKKQERIKQWPAMAKAKIMDFLRQMTREQREKTFDKIDQEFCLDCGQKLSNDGECPSCDK